MTSRASPVCERRTRSSGIESPHARRASSRPRRGDQGALPIRGVVLLAGDIHRSALRRIDGAPAYPLPEIIASGLANVNPSSGNPGPAEVTQVACHGNAPTFVTLDVDTTRADLRIIARIVAGDGNAHGSMTILRSQLR